MIINKLHKLCGLQRQFNKISAKAIATSYTSCQAANNSVDRKNEWTTIYKLPSIRHFVNLNRLKVYQTGGTVLAIPAALVMEANAYLPADTSIYISFAGITGTATLCLFSYLIKNLIGFVYLNSDKTMVKIGYLDFWGRRKNAEVPVDCIVSAPEVKHTDIALLVPLQHIVNFLGTSVKTTNSTETYKLLYRHGQILERKDFLHIFGDN